MADVRIVKSIYTGADVTSLGEVAAADTIAIPGNASIAGLTASQPVKTNASKVLTSGFVAGEVVQAVNYKTASVATGTTAIPWDNTIPQSNEGDQYMSLAVTPHNANNILIVDVLSNFSNNYAGVMQLSSALFKDSDTDALIAVTQAVGDQYYLVCLPMKYYMVAGTVSEITFKVRLGGNNAGTTTFNGAVGGGFYGGVMFSSITITEIAG